MNFKQEQAVQQLLLATAYIAETNTDLSPEEIKRVAKDAMATAMSAFDFLLLRREDGHLGIAKRNVH